MVHAILVWIFELKTVFFSYIFPHFRINIGCLFLQFFGKASQKKWSEMEAYPKKISFAIKERSLGLMLRALKLLYNPQLCRETLPLSLKIGFYHLKLRIEYHCSCDLTQRDGWINLL